MKFLFSILFFLATFVAVSADCDSYNKDETSCLKATEGSDKCAYCTSGAVGAECIAESDATSLPSSVFTCKYAAKAKPVVQAKGCDAYNKDETSCLKATEGKEKCSYCTSGAVGAECVTQSDASALPSSVFTCVNSTMV